MTPTQSDLLEFDRAFNLWRGAEDDLERARTTIRVLESKAHQLKLAMLDVRNRITQGSTVPVEK